MTDSSASTSEHVYRGWKIRIADTAVDTKSSARVELWKPEHDPRGHGGIVVPFLKRAASPADTHVVLQRRRSGLTQKWFDRGRRPHRLVKKIP
jgi:hypothetical protein